MVKDLGRLRELIRKSTESPRKSSGGGRLNDRGVSFGGTSRPGLGEDNVHGERILKKKPVTVKLRDRSC